jgi:hypothetical protein
MSQATAVWQLEGLIASSATLIGERYLIEFASSQPVNSEQILAFLDACALGLEISPIQSANLRAIATCGKWSGYNICTVTDKTGGSFKQLVEKSANFPAIASVRWRGVRFIVAQS